MRNSRLACRDVGQELDWMRAELTVRHSSDDLASSLAAHFPANSQQALQASAFANQAVRPGVIYAYQTADVRVIFFQNSASEVQVVVEHVRGNIRRICESVWTDLKKAADGSKPDLVAVEIFDDPTNSVIVKGAMGIWPRISQREAWVPLTTGVATIAGLLLFGITGDALRAATPGLAVFALTLIMILLDKKRKKIVWLSQ